MVACLLLSVLFFASTSESTRGDDQEQLPKLTVDAMRAALDARLDTMEKQGFSGVILIAVHGQIVYERGLGYATCDATERMTSDHAFLIGSITKEFLRLLTYRLEEEDVLHLDDAIGKSIPHLPKEKATLTVRQLVEHTAGLPDIIAASGEPIEYTVAYDYEPVTREEMLQRFARAKLISPPGKEEKYSNLGYQVLAAVLEKATNQSLEDLLRSRIFIPAGMSHTGYVAPDWSEVRFAEGCRADGTRWGSPYVDGMWMDDGPSWNLRGAGGLLGTAEDLARFMGALKNQRLLGAAAQRRYLDDRLVRLRRYDERGMGPAGSNGIFDAVFFWLEESDFRFVILSNRANHIAEDDARELIHLAARAR